MKKIFLSIFIISVFFVFMVGVSAYDKAKAPSSIPSDNTKMYGTRDDGDKFDYSAISFRTDDETLAGKDSLYKIKIASSYITYGNTKILNSDWFSAYCLDPNLKYPVYGIARRINGNEIDNYESLFNSALLAALFNSVNSNQMYTLFSKLNKYDYETEPVFTSEYDSSATKYKDMIEAILNNEEVVIGFKSYTRSDLEGINKETLTGSEINELLGKSGEEYELSLTIDNTFFDLYKTTSMGSSTDYNRVLWIIEHSYPTLSISRLCEDSGADETTLRSELLSLSGNETLTNDDKIDGYIYSTVQYAIWKVLGVKVNNHTIGSELVGSNELNKIYQYLIKDRSIYKNYGSKTFSSELNIVKPSSKSEIYEETTDVIKYGPYYVSSKMISAGAITLSLNNTSGVKIVDASNNEINKVLENEKFYILVEKSNKATSIIVTASANNGYVFEPTTNRGKIYYSVSPLVQNVVTGGLIKSTSAETSLDILVNPKTGVPNIALLFIATLFIFSIGYILLVRTSKPVELK